ncbi:MAG: hypothetical protein ACK4R2_09555 [Roseateles sp.]
MDTMQPTAPVADCQVAPSRAASRFSGPGNPRQARVLDSLMNGARLTNSAVRRIAGCLNGPDVIKRLRRQGLCPVTELCMEWLKTIDRDGRHVRFGVYYLTPKGQETVLAWRESQTPAATQIPPSLATSNSPT